MEPANEPKYVVEHQPGEGWRVVKVMITLPTEAAADLFLRRLLGVDKDEPTKPTHRGGKRPGAVSLPPPRFHEVND